MTKDEYQLSWTTSTLTRVKRVLWWLEKMLIFSLALCSCYSWQEHKCGNPVLKPWTSSWTLAIGGDLMIMRGASTRNQSCNTYAGIHVARGIGWGCQNLSMLACIR